MSASETAETAPAASVVVCTRGRGAGIEATARAILAIQHPNFELIVVDQSEDDATEVALQPFAGDSRLRYLHTDTVGTGRSRNIGLRAAHSPFILYTDDDWLVPPDWIDKMLAPFQANERVAVVFCAVTPLVKEIEAGFTPNFEFTVSRTVSSLWQYYYRHGMGAGMGVRRSAMYEIGGFDDWMGPGSKFMSGEDADIAIRALCLGWQRYDTAETTVIHDGLRPWSRYTELARRDWFSLGGTYAKPLRSGYPALYFITLFQLIGRGLLEPFGTIFRGQRPKGFKRFLFLLQGLAAGLRHPIDKKLILYQDQDYKFGVNS